MSTTHDQYKNGTMINRGVDFYQQTPVSKQWLAFIDFCGKLGHGRIEKLEIQDGVPVFVEKVTEKIKFT